MWVELKEVELIQCCVKVTACPWAIPDRHLVEDILLGGMTGRYVSDVLCGKVTCKTVGKESKDFPNFFFECTYIKEIIDRTKTSEAPVLLAVKVSDFISMYYCHLSLCILQPQRLDFNAVSNFKQKRTSIL